MVVREELLLPLLWSPGENSGGEPKKWVPDGYRKDVPGVHCCPETPEGMPLKSIIYKLDFVYPRCLPCGGRKTCSSIVVTRLTSVLKMSWFNWGRMAPRKMLVVVFTQTLGTGLHPSVKWRILEDRKDLLRLRARSLSVQARENLAGPHLWRINPGPEEQGSWGWKVYKL